MIVVDDRKESRHGGQVVIWWFSLEQLNDGAAYTPDVGSRRCARQLNDFGGHPVWCTNYLRLFVWTSEGACRDTKVCQLDRAIFCGEDICALDISVDDTLIVEILQSLKDLCHVYADEILGKFAVFFANRVQGSIFAVPARNAY